MLRLLPPLARTSRRSGGPLGLKLGATKDENKTNLVDIDIFFDKMNA